MSEPVIKCQSVYKIFGVNAERMLKEANGNDTKAPTPIPKECVTKLHIFGPIG